MNVADLAAHTYALIVSNDVEAGNAPDDNARRYIAALSFDAAASFAEEAARRDVTTGKRKVDGVLTDDDDDVSEGEG